MSHVYELKSVDRHGSDGTSTVRINSSSQQSSSSVASWVRLISKEMPLAGGVHVLLVKSGGHLRDQRSLQNGFIGRKRPALCFCSPRGPPPRLHPSC